MEISWNFVSPKKWEPWMLIGPLFRHKYCLNYPIDQLGGFLFSLDRRQVLSVLFQIGNTRVNWISFYQTKHNERVKVE